MATNNPTLYEKVGLSFEFKKSLTDYLNKAINVSEIVTGYNVAGNTPQIRQAAVNRVSLTTPAMKFEYKAGAYMALKLIDDAIIASESVSQDDKNAISSLTNLVSRYVGLAGDDDYHFMVAVYKVSEAISEALDINDSV